MDDYIDGLGLSRFDSFLSNRLAYTRASTLHSLLTPAFRNYAGGTKESSEEIRRVCDEMIDKLNLPNHKAAAAVGPEETTDTTTVTTTATTETE